MAPTRPQWHHSARSGNTLPSVASLSLDRDSRKLSLPLLPPHLHLPHNPHHSHHLRCSPLSAAAASNRFAALCGRNEILITYKDQEQSGSSSHNIRTKPKNLKDATKVIGDVIVKEVATIKEVMFELKGGKLTKDGRRAARAGDNGATPATAAAPSYEPRAFDNFTTAVVAYNGTDHYVSRTPSPLPPAHLDCRIRRCPDSGFCQGPLTWVGQG